MSSTSSEPERVSSTIVEAVGMWIPAFVLAMVGAVAMLLVQVTVTADVGAATRTCGSAFDAVTDRSGWELWWARDLDEPDDAVRAALIRTDLCPRAVNQRIVLASVLGAIALVLALIARARSKGRQRRLQSNGPSGPLVRLGRATTWTGATLSVAGVLAIVVLVADADSTLFLYVDRLVVGLVGLIVLMPTMALFVIGRALMLAGARLEQHELVEDDVDV